MRWYVIHTYSGHENRVKSALEQSAQRLGLQDKLGRVLIPTEEITEIKHGKRKTTAKQLYPSYLMVEMDLTDDVWNVVSSTPGVTSFLGSRRKPQAMRSAEAARLLARIDGTKVAGPADIPFHAGDSVKIVDGPFANFTGVINEVDKQHGKVKVMVTIFGRTTPVELDFIQINEI